MTKLYSCEVCEKETRITTGWHLEGNLNFCSDNCVSKYIEINMQEVFKIVKNQEKRLSELERKISRR
ncbi:MAG: hypothetical protein AABY22_16900 [Nanoarchaeota archaeon]